MLGAVTRASCGPGTSTPPSSLASKNNRSTRWILRMDTLLKAIDMSSQKEARRCHDEELSRAARSFRPDALNDSGRREKVIGLTPESVIGFVRNQ